jgi:hypothetical protein
MSIFQTKTPGGKIDFEIQSVPYSQCSNSLSLSLSQSPSSLSSIRCASICASILDPLKPFPSSGGLILFCVCCSSPQGRASITPIKELFIKDQSLKPAPGGGRAGSRVTVPIRTSRQSERVAGWIMEQLLRRFIQSTLLIPSQG